MAHWKAFTDERAQREWDAALSGFIDCSPFQSYAWGEYRRALGWQPYRWAAFNERNEVVAMLQGCVRRYRIGVGMLLSEGGPVGDLTACDESLQSQMRETVGLRWLYCRLRCDRPRATSEVLRMKRQGWTIPWAEMNSGYTAVLDLSIDDESMLDKATRSWRQNVRRAEKNNLVTRQWLNPDPETIHAAFRSMEQAKGLAEQHSGDEIKQILKQTGQQMIVYRSDDQHGELMSLAGALVFGRQANLWFFATTKPGRATRASYSVFFALARHCKRIGVTEYDLGGIDPVNNPGVYRFKKDSGATPVELLGEWDWATQRWLRFLGNLAIEQRTRLGWAETALKRRRSSESGVVAGGAINQPDTLLRIETN